MAPSREENPAHPAQAGDTAPVQFDVVLRSPEVLPPAQDWRFSSFLEMLEPDNPEQDGKPLLIGADLSGPLELTLADLRRAVTRADSWCKQHGYTAGDSILLLRLPYSSEVALAAAAIALMSLGLRVVLPMSYDRTTLPDMASIAGCKALLWCAGDGSDDLPERAQQADAMFRQVAHEVGMATFSLDGQLDWHGPPKSTDPTPVPTGRPEDPLEREVLVLSTSGSTGRPKLARYTEGALLRVAEAWKAAGLMSEELTGGRSICPTVSHSMGFRNVLHAVWNRQPTLLAQPEWLEEKPKKFVKLLERCQPQHITCGPAFLRDLSLLSSKVQRIRNALGSMRVVVSSGAADDAVGRVMPEGVRVANAFGMTELQQALNTLLGPPTSVPGALGRPLPGVAAAVRYADEQRPVGRLYVSAPFSASGYVSEQDFGPWFDTGDLVRVEGDDLVWLGRAGEDFLNTGHGVKISLAELTATYESLRLSTEAVLFVPLSSRSGAGALVYVGGVDPSSEETRARLLEAVHQDHVRMTEEHRDFALDHMAITVIGCVAGRPPIHGPGKVDRGRALEDTAELLEAMNDVATNDPRVIHIPRHESERPDWRRYV